MRNEVRRAEKWLVKRLDEALLSVTRNDQTRIIELQGSKRALPEHAKRMRANEHEKLLVHESELNHPQAMRRPREVAKASGIPKSLIETSGAVFERALRARRCSQERR